jgi:hypothetical protein
VQFYEGRNLLERFQALDFAGMMGITGAGIHLGFQRMGNGAHLAYPKRVFEAVGGYTATHHRASGDDLFLLQKVARQYGDEAILFLKNPDAAVFTAAMPDWPSFFAQRLRWGTKNAALPEWRVKAILAIVYLFCCSIVIHAVAAPFAGGAVSKVLALQCGVKVLSDYILLRRMCFFFRRRALLRWFWPSFFIHTGYIALMGTASLFIPNYQWKGRLVR